MSVIYLSQSTIWFNSRPEVIRSLGTIRETIANVKLSRHIRGNVNKASQANYTTYFYFSSMRNVCHI